MVKVLLEEFLLKPVMLFISYQITYILDDHCKTGIIVRTIFAKLITNYLKIVENKILPLKALLSFYKEQKLHNKK